LTKNNRRQCVGKKMLAAMLSSAAKEAAGEIHKPDGHQALH
jgi:hypothetical protein